MPSPNIRLLFILVVSLLSGCLGPQLYHRQLSLLNKGMSPSITIAKLGQEPRIVQLVDYQGRLFRFHRYLLNNGVLSDQYYLAFEHDRLVYWGFIYEFRRQPDQQLNEALNLALIRYDKIKK